LHFLNVPEVALIATLALNVLLYVHSAMQIRPSAKYWYNLSIVQLNIQLIVGAITPKEFFVVASQVVYIPSETILL